MASRGSATCEAESPAAAAAATTWRPRAPALGAASAHLSLSLSIINIFFEPPIINNFTVPSLTRIRSYLIFNFEFEIFFKCTENPSELG